MTTITADSWTGCYSRGWGNELTPDSFAHPAKVGFVLAQRIYAHALECGFIARGGAVLDPFGGIGGFAYGALFAGLNWTGVELEEKFVTLGRANIAAWNARYGGAMQRWGTARLLQGDSRKLLEVVGSADLVVSSPPYAEANVGTLGNYKGPASLPGGCGDLFKAAGGKSENYTTNPGNLGNLPDRGLDLVLSSPPYADSLEKSNGIDPTKIASAAGPNSQALLTTKYGAAAGQLGALKSGDLDMVLSSPPFLQSTGGSGGDNDPNGPIDSRLLRRHAAGNGAARAYGDERWQLGNMAEGAYDAVVGSPPFESSLASGGINHTGVVPPHDTTGFVFTDYENSDGNIGATSGDSFWSAALDIVAQCYMALRPGGHAIWVTKRYVMGGKIVEFTEQWIRLCESVGFRLACHHHAMLVRDDGEQAAMVGESKVHRKERKSFFRRLAEKKGSPAIDWEDVVCMVK